MRNLIIKKLKKVYRLSDPGSFDSEFRILILVQKMCPIVHSVSLQDLGLAKHTVSGLNDRHK